MSANEPSSPALDAETLKKVDLFLEDFYPFAKQAGDRMSYVKLGKTQVRGMETFIASASRFSQIINYIKNRAGKDRKKTWINIAPDLLDQLDRLETKAKELGKNNPAVIIDIKMKLARGWANQVVSQYLYADALKEEE